MLIMHDNNDGHCELPNGAEIGLWEAKRDAICIRDRLVSQIVVLRSRD